LHLWANENIAAFSLALPRQGETLNSEIARVGDKIDEVNSSLKKTSKKFQTSVSKIETDLNKVVGSHVVGSYDLTLFGIHVTICGTIIQFFCS